MQQAFNLITTTESIDDLQFDVEATAARSEPMVLDAKLLGLIGGGEDAPHKGW